MRLSIRSWQKLKTEANSALVDQTRQERVASLLVTRSFYALVGKSGNQLAMEKSPQPLIYGLALGWALVVSGAAW